MSSPVNTICRCRWRTELAFVRRYTEIERLRYGDRLQIIIDVPPETLPLYVPSFILQSLVENAIRHGIANQTGSGTVVITARRYNDRLQLEVKTTAPVCRTRWMFLPVAVLVSAMPGSD